MAMDDKDQWDPEDAATALNKRLSMEITPQKKPSQKEAAWDGFSDFTGHTSIHGIQYLGEEGRHWSERLLWAICVFISLCICCLFIHNIWRKWEETPVIVSFSETSTPIWDIPFPAITICPQTKTKRDVFNFADFHENEQHYRNDHDYKQKSHRFASLSLICDPEATEDRNMSRPEEYNIVRTLHEIAPDQSSTIKNCTSNQMEYPCEHFFHEIVTDSGICFSFNIIPYQDLFFNNLYPDIMDFDIDLTWNMEDGYNRSRAMDEEYPWHLHISGINRGVDIYLDSLESDIDINCRGAIQGYNAIIHPPDELPQLAKQNFRIPLGKEIVVSVKPEMTTTSPALQRDKVEKRQCYFNNERKLKYFKVYNQNNCEIECLAEYTREIFECVPFWIPVPQDISVCNATMIGEQYYAESYMHSREFANGLAKVSDKVEKSKPEEPDLDCNCLPACTSITYTTDISQADFYVPKNKNLNSTATAKGVIRSRLKVGFAVSQFITQKRSELYGLNDFIANIGGLMGLFMGISAISFVEIAYFCSCRWMINKKFNKSM